jgi:hypothetical protein
LLANGIRPSPSRWTAISDREQTPRDDHGNYDFEVLEALDRNSSTGTSSN